MSQNNHIHHVAVVENLNKAFLYAIVLNMAYVLAEAISGFHFNSMGLLSDAGHNLSDAATLVIAMVAFRLSHHAATVRFNYGYKKATVLASLVNALLLCFAVGAILIESISKLPHPEEVDGDAIAWVAGAGIVVKGITVWLLLREKERDLNVKGAFLHMAADALVSVGVLLSGVLIDLTHIYIIDPVIGVFIAVVVGCSAFNLLRKSIRLSIDGVPEGIDYDKVKADIASVEGVKGVAELHIWPVSTTITAMTVHVMIETPSLMDDITAEIHRRMETAGITQSTVETSCEVSGDSGLGYFQ